MRRDRQVYLALALVAIVASVSIALFVLLSGETPGDLPVEVTVELSVEEVLVDQGRSVEVEVEVETTETFPDQLTLELTNLPPGVNSEEDTRQVTLSQQERTSTRFTLTAATDAEPGLHSVGVRASVGQETKDRTPFTLNVVGSGSVVVDIRNFAYHPANLTVRAGTTVVFVNHDGVSHTVTEPNYERDSGSIDSGQSWEITFTEPGDSNMSFFCRPHPYMEGTIEVLPAA